MVSNASGVSRGPFGVAVDRSARVPLFRQIYDRFREAILSETLPPGAKLPSARSLASQLAVSRGTVEAAYDLLSGEGFIETRGTSGTYVEGSLGFVLQRNVSGRAGRAGDADRGAEAPAVASPQLVPFRIDLPSLDRFPRKIWTRIAARRVREFGGPVPGAVDGAGLISLRRHIAAHIRIARGISCGVENVFVTAGFRGALGVISHALIAPGDAVWVEDPGYFIARQGLADAGTEVVPVPVDEDGLVVREGLARAPAARFAMVTPSHQSPLGVTLSLPRRLSLLDWATGDGAWIIEDDYDSEFRYVGRPVAALKSLDRTGRVLYAGSFSKVLLPDLRLGYLVVPDGLVDRFESVCAGLQPAPSPLLQAVVSDLMAEGHFGRHVHRMRKLYGERRAALADALARVFGASLRVELRAGGMHLLAWPRTRDADTELERRARAKGLAPLALSRFSVAGDLPPGLLLGFTNIPVESATDHAGRLYDALALQNRS